MTFLKLSTDKTDYSKTVIIQILLIFSVLTLGDVISLFNFQNPEHLASGILLLLESIYLIILFQLAQQLNSNNILRACLIIVISFLFLLSIIALNPFIDLVEDKVPWLIAIHILLCALECYVIILGLRDIYGSDLHLTERLWGSVAMYLLIALGWASLYEIIILAEPASIGVNLIPGYQSYSESLYQSLCSLSGTGSVYTTPSHLFRNLNLIESVWGVLFLVMLIGRIFSLPSLTENK